MQAPTATALFSLPDGADDSETLSPYFTDRPLVAVFRTDLDLGNREFLNQGDNRCSAPTTPVHVTQPYTGVNIALPRVGPGLPLKVPLRVSVVTPDVKPAQVKRPSERLGDPTNFA
jgi:hypothetical protein